MPRARKARTLVDDVHAVIRADILAGRLIPGQPLRMAVLRERFDVSLSVVREALTRLSEQRLVRSMSQLGFTVVPLSVEDLHDLTNVRIDIETLVIRRAVAEGDEAWETGVKASLNQLAAVLAPDEDDLPGGTGDGSEDGGYREAHAAFHAALAAGCRSPRLSEIRARLFDAAELYRHWHVPEQRGITAGDPHSEMGEAVLARDADRAAHLVAAHIRTAADHLLSVRV